MWEFVCLRHYIIVNKYLWLASYEMLIEMSYELQCLWNSFMWMCLHGNWAVPFHRAYMISFWLLCILPPYMLTQVYERCSPQTINVSKYLSFSKTDLVFFVHLKYLFQLSFISQLHLKEPLYTVWWCQAHHTSSTGLCCHDVRKWELLGDLGLCCDTGIESLLPSSIGLLRVRGRKQTLLLDG